MGKLSIGIMRLSKRVNEDNLWVSEGVDSEDVAEPAGCDDLSEEVCFILGGGEGWGREGGVNAKLTLFDFQHLRPIRISCATRAVKQGNGWLCLEN